MHTDEATYMLRDLLDDIWRVPEVPCVELDSERRMVGLVEQLDRFAERRDHRPVLAPDAVDRLEPDAHARALRLVADRTQPFDDRVSVLTGPGETNDAGRMKRGEPVHGRADRIDARTWVVWSLHQRQRQDRGNRRDRRRGSETGCSEQLERFRVASIR